MRVANVSFTRMWGGAEIFEKELSATLKSSHHQVAFFCRDGSPLEKRLGEDVHHLYTLNPRDYLDYFSSRRLMHKIESFEPDVVVFHALKDLWLFTPYLIAKRKFKTVGVLHTFVEGPSKLDPMHRLVYKNLDRLVCTTELQLRAVQKLLPLRTDQYSVIPYWTNLEKFNGARRPVLQEELKLPHDVPLVGFVGRLEVAKGPGLLLSAFQQLLHQGAKFHGVIVGGDSEHEPNLRNELREFLRQSGLQNHVTFFPFREDIERVMGSLDIFVMPSKKEAFGMVLTEAMASGCCCVSSNTGGVPEILDEGRAGTLYESGNSQSLAEALAPLIESREKREAIAQSGKNRIARHFSKSVVYPKWENVLFDFAAHLPHELR